MTNLHDTTTIVCAITLLAVLYVLTMLFLYRKSLFHVWNHLTFFLFIIYVIQVGVVFILLFVPDKTPCLAFNIINDGARGGGAIALFIFFCVLVVPPCMEPQKEKIFRYECGLFGFIAFWTILQVVLYVVTGDFQDERPGDCHLRVNQYGLAAIFIWAPYFLNTVLAMYFIYWVGQQNVMLSLKRVKTFAWILFFSCALKSVSAIAEIEQIMDLNALNSTQFAEHEAAYENSDKFNTIIFIQIIFYMAHLISLSFAFSYAEDLLPLWARDRRIKRVLTCYCCHEEENLMHQQYSSNLLVNRSQHPSVAIGGEKEGENENSNNVDDENEVDDNNKNSNNNQSPKYVKNTSNLDTAISSGEESNPFTARVPGEQKPTKKKSSNLNTSSENMMNHHHYGSVSNPNSNTNLYPGSHHALVSSAAAMMTPRGSCASTALLSSGRCSTVSGAMMMNSELRTALMNGIRDGRDVSHSLTYFMTMIRNDIVAGIVSSIESSSGGDRPRIITTNNFIRSDGSSVMGDTNTNNAASGYYYNNTISSSSNNPHTLSNAAAAVASYNSIVSGTNNTHNNSRHQSRPRVLDSTNTFRSRQNNNENDDDDHSHNNADDDSDDDRNSRSSQFYRARQDDE